MPKVLHYYAPLGEYKNAVSKRLVSLTPFILFVICKLFSGNRKFLDRIKNALAI